MESQRQNPEFRNNPENFQLCIDYRIFRFYTPTGFKQAKLCKIQGLFKELPTVFKD